MGVVLCWMKKNETRPDYRGHGRTAIGFDAGGTHATEEFHSSSAGARIEASMRPVRNGKAANLGKVSSSKTLGQQII